MLLPFCTHSAGHVGMKCQKISLSYLCTWLIRGTNPLGRSLSLTTCKFRYEKIWNVKYLKYFWIHERLSAFSFFFCVVWHEICQQRARTKIAFIYNAWWQVELLLKITHTKIDKVVQVEVSSGSNWNPKSQLSVYPIQHEAFKVIVFPRGLKFI